MKKLLIERALIDGDNISGYAAIGLHLDQENLDHINRLRIVFEGAKELDERITNIGYATTGLQVSLLNDDFEEGFDFYNDNTESVVLIDPDDLVNFTNHGENPYRVKGFNLLVAEKGITVVVEVKHSDDEIWAVFEYDKIFGASAK